MIEIKEITEEKDWTPEAVLPSVPFQQSFWYGEMQQMRGREVKRFEIYIDGALRVCAQFVAYPLLKSKKYWYAAYGPIVKDADENILECIEKEFRARLVGDDVVFARLDFSPSLSQELSIGAKSIFTPATKASSFGSYFQPRHEWYTDISKSADEILVAMHQKTRYSVRYAEKKGIKIEVVEGVELPQHLARFVELMRDTARRNKFSLHDDAYYKCFFEEIAKRNNGFLVEASLEGELLAIHFVVVEGAVAHYVFGASSDSRKELCAPYLAHFAGMIEGKKRGAIAYNFGGISNGDEASHWQSITAFKKRFGGRIVAHGGYYDIVEQSFWYYLYIARKWIKNIL
jgi:lipid II:glycine glycyltransferase (peptidoglycan interpeptide bridge formation enzyme)